MLSKNKTKILIRSLIDKKIKICVAESVTGGKFAHELVKHPNASKIFDYSIVSYSNESKINILDIKNKINQFGVVSEEVALEMVKQVSKFSHNKKVLSLSCTGQAGPNFLDKNHKKVLSLSSPFIEKAIYESCKIKKKVVEKDEKEIALRKVLNFGHTFAHAYEAGLGYSHKLNHGEAVILGMKTALSFSFKENMLSKSEYNLIINHIDSSGLPSSIKKYFSIRDLNKILSFMIKDKKNNSEKINLVLLKKIGKPIFNKQYSKKKLNLFLKKFLTN